MQSAPARAAVAIGAIVAVAALFVVLTSGEDEPEPTRGPATEAAPAPEGPGRSAAERDRPHRPGPERITVAAGGGEVEELSYRKGDQVRLAFDSEVSGQIHIHGYDRYVDLEPGEVSRIRFATEIEGVFEIELHGTGAEIARLTVKP